MASRNGLERWRGEVTAKLEGIEKTLGEISGHLTTQGNRLSTVEKAQERLTAKVGVYAGLVGAAMGGAVHYVMKAISG